MVKYWNYCFGKTPARFDSRTFTLKMLLQTVLPPVPPSYSVDESLQVKFVESDFGNEDWGDCVIAARANQTLRFEYIEQKKIIPISTEECLKEYWKEQGATCWSHPDNGLSMLTSLKRWRKAGWKAGDKKYRIYAFGSLDPTSKLQLQQAIYLLNGVQLGVHMPQSALDEFDAGLPWTVRPGLSPIRGGHAVDLIAYDSFGVTCVTWGIEQKITWEWISKYADEAYAVVNAANVPNSCVDEKSLEAYLEAVTELN